MEELAGCSTDLDFLDNLPPEARESYRKHWGWIDEELAKTSKTRVEEFFERHIRHTKGAWYGQPWQFLPWQRKVCRDLFGTLNPETGLRQYTTAYITVPRKNGKTEFAAGLVLYMVCSDGEPGAEVYGAAHDRNQAGTLFTMAKRMVLQDPDLRERFTVRRNALVYESETTGENYYHPISSEAGGAHSTSPHFCVCDEVHTWAGRKGQELYEALTTGQDARTQPLTLTVTTRGNDTDGICYELDTYADQVERGVIVDPSFYSFRAYSEKTEDWSNPDTWVKANPSVGRTVHWGKLVDAHRKTEGMPAARAAFRTFKLNTWGEGDARWIDQDKWKALAGSFTAEDLLGLDCYGGLDLSNTQDLTAFVLVFPPQAGCERWRILPHFWVPEAAIAAKVKTDAVPYDQWTEDGLIIATAGDVVDHRKVAATILEIADKFNLIETAFDRWGSVQISTHLQDEGLELTQWGQGFASMSPPTKSFSEKVSDGSLEHTGHRVMDWCLDNTVVKIDEAENMKPDKRRSQGRIDGTVAAIMALGCAEASEGPKVLTSSPLSFI